MYFQINTSGELLFTIPLAPLVGNSMKSQDLLAGWLDVEICWVCFVFKRDQFLFNTFGYHANIFSFLEKDKRPIFSGKFTSTCSRFLRPTSWCRYSDRSDDSTLEGLGVLLIWELAARAGAKGSKRGPGEHSNPLLYCQSWELTKHFGWIQISSNFHSVNGSNVMFTHVDILGHFCTAGFWGCRWWNRPQTFQCSPSQGRKANAVGNPDLIVGTLSCGVTIFAVQKWEKPNNVFSL